MSTDSIAEILRAYLAREGLVLCRANDTQFPLDGEREAGALHEVASLVEDAISIDRLAEWENEVTKEIPREALRQLKHQALQ